MKTKTDKTKSSNKSSSPFFNSKNDSGFFTAQPKLKVGQPGDKYEVEADRVADEVVNSQPENQPFFAPAQTQLIQPKPIVESITPLVQRQEEEEEVMPKLQDITVRRQEEEEELQMQPVEEEEEMLQTQPLEEEEEMIQTQPIEEEEEMLQPKSDSPVKDTHSATEQLLNSSKGNGSPLNSEIRSQMENSFSADFGGVKIHTDSTAVQLNKELGAQAFTTGNNIYFNEGKYNPKSQNGKKLLAHELTHTVQQSNQKKLAKEIVISRAISTPIETYVKNADKTKNVSFKVNSVNIVVKPDSKTGKKSMENRAGTNFSISNNGTPGYKYKKGKITKVNTVPVPTITIHTIYGKGVTAKSKSGYGKGTTTADVKAGNTSLGYHEGSHGTDFLNYVKNKAIPQFKGTVGMSIAEFKKAQAKYKNDWKTYSKQMVSYSKKLTDCVGEKASFCPKTK